VSIGHAVRLLLLLGVLAPWTAIAQQRGPAAASPGAVPAQASAPAAASTAKASLFRDAEDGHFDMSRWLLEHRGFLPVPIIVTDPAVGNGGGVALLLDRRGRAVRRRW